MKIPVKSSFRLVRKVGWPWGLLGKRSGSHTADCAHGSSPGPDSLRNTAGVCAYMPQTQRKRQKGPGHTGVPPPAACLWEACMPLENCPAILSQCQSDNSMGGGVIYRGLSICKGCARGIPKCHGISEKGCECPQCSHLWQEVLLGSHTLDTKGRLCMFTTETSNTK